MEADEAFDESPIARLVPEPPGRPDSRFAVHIDDVIVTQVLTPEEAAAYAAYLNAGVAEHDAKRPN